MDSLKDCMDAPKNRPNVLDCTQNAPLNGPNALNKELDALENGLDVLKARINTLDNNLDTPDCTQYAPEKASDALDYP